ncbi:maleylpyruvate isomerase N-terminal domain-containing protein [Streptomyces sp. NBC_01465]|nr:maleylpyruvate isomerase N-terminal domain-containing protein [Streptomyces sp. NBC_01465]
MIDRRRVRESWIPRSAASRRRAVGRVPGRARRRARSRCAGADLPRVDAVGAGSSPRERAARPAWSAESTAQLLGALREYGPDRDCWTWWGGSQSPRTSGAVARHQVQEATVHTYDAQTTVGAPPLPTSPSPVRRANSCWPCTAAFRRAP